jgi:hypothetical protein
MGLLLLQDFLKGFLKEILPPTTMRHPFAEVLSRPCPTIFIGKLDVWKDRHSFRQWAASVVSLGARLAGDNVVFHFHLLESRRPSLREKFLQNSF